jgi:hypothetical protein
VAIESGEIAIEMGGLLAENINSYSLEFPKDIEE